MKKIIRSLASLSLVFIITVFGFTTSSAAMESEAMSGYSNQTVVSDVQEVSTDIKEISRAEFVQNLAKQKDISLAEAYKYDSIQTQNETQKEMLQYSKISPLATTHETIYRQVTKTFNTGSGGSFWSQVVVVVQVKLERYNTGTLVYQKFSEVLDVGADAYGSGPAEWTTIAQSASISPVSTYGNNLVMMLSGNSVVAISSSLEVGAEAAGFSLGYSIGGTLYYRKFIQINYTFDSNYNLN